MVKTMAKLRMAHASTHDARAAWANTRNLIKGPGVASVAGLGWWSASDVPEDLKFQL